MKIIHENINSLNEEIEEQDSHKKNILTEIRKL